jgi:hypothetical protein
MGNVESLGAACLRRLAHEMLRQHAWLQQVSIRAWCWVDPSDHDEAARERVASRVTDVQFASSVELPKALLQSDRPSRLLVMRLLDQELAAGCCDHYAELADGLSRFGARQITLNRSG